MISSDALRVLDVTGKRLTSIQSCEGYVHRKHCRDDVKVGEGIYGGRLGKMNH